MTIKSRSWFQISWNTRSKEFFPSGVRSATMVCLGAEGWSFDSLINVFGSVRKTGHTHTFISISMHDQLVNWGLKTINIDVILMHTTSFVSLPVIRDSGIPSVSYFSVPPLPITNVLGTRQSIKIENITIPIIYVLGIEDDTQFVIHHKHITLHITTRNVWFLTRSIRYDLSSTIACDYIYIPVDMGRISSNY